MKRVFKVLTLLCVVAFVAVAPAAAYADAGAGGGSRSPLLPIAGVAGLAAVGAAFATTLYCDGETVTYTNSSSTAIASGDLVLLTNRVGVALVDIAPGASGEVAITKVHKVAKTTSEVWTIGQQLYYVEGTGKLTTTAGSNQKAGIAALAAGSSDTTGYCKLNA